MTLAPPFLARGKTILNIVCTSDTPSFQSPDRWKCTTAGEHGREERSIPFALVRSLACGSGFYQRTLMLISCWYFKSTDTWSVFLFKNSCSNQYFILHIKLWKLHWYSLIWPKSKEQFYYTGHWNPLMFSCFCSL